MKLDAWRTAFDTFIENPAPWAFLLEWACASRCLPIYCDWTHAFGVTEQGDVVAFEHEAWPGVSGPGEGPVTDLRWLNIALHQGVKRYAWLSDVLPPRPGHAQDCSMRSGTGHVPVPDIICYCGGAGWVPADDTWVNKDRFRR